MCCHQARREDITDEAINEWEDRNAQASRHDASQDTSSGNKPESQDSQPPRPPNWRSAQRQSTRAKPRAHSEITNEEQDQELEERPNKRQRYISEDTDPSASSAGCLTPAEDLHQDHAIAVVIPGLKDLDAADYMSVTISQSTIPSHSSQTISQLESQGQRVAVLANNPTQRTTIPDSQDFEDFSLNTESQATSVNTGQSFRSGVNLEYSAGGSYSRQITTPSSVVPDSVGVTGHSHIPSHQPHNYTVDISATRNIPIEISTSNKHESQDPSCSHPAPQPHSWQSQGSGPVFFTQTSYRAREISPESRDSLQSQGLDLQLQAAQAAAQFVQTSQSSRISQAAQVLPNKSVELFTMDNTQERAEGQEPSGPHGNLNASEDMIDINPPFDHHPSNHANTEQTGAEQILDLLEGRPSTSHYDSAIERPGSEGNAHGQEPPVAAGEPRSPEPSPWTPSAMAANSEQFLTQPQQTSMAQGDAVFNDVWDQQPPQTLNPEVQPVPRTISPAAISMPVQIEGPALTLLPSFSEREAEAVSSSDPLPPTPEVSVAMGHPSGIPMDNEPVSSPELELDGEEAQDFYTVTIPMSSRLREVYEKHLIDNREIITGFNAAYVNAANAGPGDEVEQPSSEAIQQCRQVLNTLQNLCDFPHDLLGTPMEHVPDIDQVKYAVDANPKFNFINELLEGIRRGDILIVARPALLALLCRLVESLQLGCACSYLNKDTATPSDPVTVTLVPPDEEIEHISMFSAVIGYDPSFDNSGASKALENASVSSDQTPLILKLVTTHSIEHFRHLEPRKSNDTDDINALLYGIVQARHLIVEPRRGQPEPHEAAKIFYDYINKTEDVLQWDPVPLPDECLHSMMSQTSAFQAPATQGLEGSPALPEGRKRKLVRIGKPQNCYALVTDMMIRTTTATTQITNGNVLAIGRCPSSQPRR